MRPLRSALPVLTVASLLLLGACSSDGSDGAPTTTTRPATTTTGDGDRTTTTIDEGDGTTTTDPDDDDTTTTEPDGGPVDADDQAYVDALVASFGDLSGEDVPVSTEQATCVAEGFIDILGGKRLAAAGMTPEAFAESGGTDLPDSLGIDEAIANDLYDVYGDCDLDLAELFGTGGSTELSAEEKACIDALLTEENLRASFVAEITGEELEDDPLEESFSCIDGFDDLTTSTTTR